MGIVIRSRVSIVLVLAMTWALPAYSAETDAWLGVWEQVATDAGACPTCRIAFRAEPLGLSVAANNGWAAALDSAQDGDIAGVGRWSEAERSWVAGRPFTISFRLKDDQLSMTMAVDTGTGPRSVVRATYKRARQGV